MKRIALILAAVIGLSMVAAPPAQAATGSIRINNLTNRSVWITIYSSCGFTCKWSIIGGGAGAFCLTPHQSRYMDYWKRSPMVEVKFRAEVKYRADCAGPNLSDTYDTRIRNDSRDEETVGNVHERGNDDSFYMKIVGN